MNDVFGNVVGTINTSNHTLVWSSCRIGSYGLLPDAPDAPLLDGTSVTLAQATLWRSHRIDPTGFYYMGARYYEPNSGRFISPDPLGHAASMSLYDYANGDPVNGLDPDGRCAKGLAAGWNGSISAGSPNSTSFQVGTMIGAMFNGGVTGLGQGAQNVSGYTSYQEHLAIFDGDSSMAANAAWNPAYMAIRGTMEATGGMGLSPSNLGTNLSGGQRAWSTVQAGLGAVGTVGAGTGIARLATLSGVTAPVENFAAQQYFNAVGRPGYYSSFVPGTARLNIELGGRTLFRAANSEGAAMFGEFASTQRPTTPLAAIEGAALDPAITANRATSLFQVQTRFGLSVEGVAAPQGAYQGGFNQVFQLGREGLPTWKSTTPVPYLGE